MKSGNGKYDLVVVGGGVIGLSCILHLLDECPGIKIALIDSPTKPGIASRAAAGMLAPYAEFKTDGPLFKLCCDSLFYYAEFLDRFDLSAAQGGPDLYDTGIIIPSTDDQYERVKAIVDLTSKYTNVQQFKGKRLQEFEPAINPHACKEAFLVPGGMIDPARLHDHMVEVLQGRIDRYDALARAFSRDESGITAVEIDNGARIECETILVASGAWSASLGEMLGLDIPIIPVKGQVARFNVPDGVLKHIVHAQEVYLAPRQGQGILVGATSEHVGFDESVSDQKTEELAKRASKYLPSLTEYPLVDSWCGFRPAFQDGHPAIGWSDSIPNLLLATGHYRNGILLTPVTGRTICDAYTQRTNLLDSSMTPGRLGI